MTYYLLRFDDINPKMNWRRFNKLKLIINKYKIKSILGVVPKCEDKSISKYPENKNYLINLQKMKSEGDFIAQHGYTHITDAKDKGLYGCEKRSEFAGLDYQTQYERIKKGKNILIKNNLWQPIFMAPVHSFDNTTLKVLRKLDFKLITDGFSRYPYELNGIKLIPQLTSMPLPKYLPLISQLCIHINSLSEEKFNFLVNFIEKNHHLFISPIDALKFEKNNLIFRIENIIIKFFIQSFRNLKKLL
jgi:predicted deacetylase